MLIAIGMRFSDRVTGNLKTYAKQAKVVHLDIDRSEIDKNVKTDVAVVADCKESLPAITALLNKNHHQEWRDWFRELDDKERQKVIEPAIHPQSGPLLMGEALPGTNLAATAAVRYPRATARRPSPSGPYGPVPNFCVQPTVLLEE